MSNKVKKLEPNQAVCLHEGCFEAAQIKGHCRKHFLSVLSGKSEGDQKPKAQLSAVGDAARKPKKRKSSQVSLDEAFAESQGLNFENMDYQPDEIDSEIFGRSVYNKNKKVA